MRQAFRDHSSAPKKASVLPLRIHTIMDALAKGTGEGGAGQPYERGVRPGGKSARLLVGCVSLLLLVASSALETSTRRDGNGVTLIFPSASHPYTSLVVPSGRHCGYLNVPDAASLPAKDRRIVLVEGLGLAYYFVLSTVSARSSNPAARSPSPPPPAFSLLPFSLVHPFVHHCPRVHLHRLQ